MSEESKRLSDFAAERIEKLRCRFHEAKDKKFSNLLPALDFVVCSDPKYYDDAAWDAAMVTKFRQVARQTIVIGPRADLANLQEACAELSRLIDEDRKAHGPRFPKRAKWLKREMKKREMTVNRLDEVSEVDHKSINKILNGFAVRDSVLEKIVEGLNAESRQYNLPAVKIEDVPTD